MIEHLSSHERIKIVVLSALILGTIFLALPAGETSTTSDSQLIQFGHTSCNITPGNVGCTSPNIIFNPPFPVGGNLFEQCYLNQSASPGTGQTPELDYFMNEALVTWANMPAGVTEFLGNTQHRIFIDNGAPIGTTNVALFVNVIVVGSTMATLDLQFSTNSGTTWTSFGINVPINILGLQSGLIIPPLTLFSGNTLFRVIGQNGNGIISPQFSMLYFDFLQTYPTTIPGATFTNPIDNTMFNCSFTFASPVSPITVQTTAFDWIASNCPITKGNSC